VARQDIYLDIKTSLLFRWENLLQFLLYGLAAVFITAYFLSYPDVRRHGGSLERNDNCITCEYNVQVVLRSLYTRGQKDDNFVASFMLLIIMVLHQRQYECHVVQIPVLKNTPMCTATLSVDWHAV
jgi:hypothetical protein